jgi:hypothetical protein
MDTIRPEGGWGNEAVEIGLQYANREYDKDPLQQVILIGDAQANAEAEVRNKRLDKGETYWAQS